MLNQCQFIGNVGKDPTVNFTQAGKKVANFSLAVTEKWKDGDERKERTEWVRLVCFQEGLCNVIEQYVQKGNRLFVSGKMQTRQYEQDGVTKYSTEVILQNLEMLGGQNSGGNAGQQSGSFDDDIEF
ncbi:MAG: single-stranded DNA-binding protein [Proteobacteria bacterium]|nr:single-stranded DNA-binding protein [Pseudomonadota bacterium]